MKQTVVPAQVTTVEDRIIGNLGMTQVILLSLPVLTTGLVFVAFPPAMHISVYKLVCLTALLIICGGLAVRFKGKLMLYWIIVVLRYNLRPGYYLFNKNSSSQRNLNFDTPGKPLDDTEPVVAKQPQISGLTTAERYQVFEAIDNPANNLSFATNKKGNLYVRITEIKSKG
jgi:hypothetical protein